MRNPSWKRGGPVLVRGSSRGAPRVPGAPQPVLEKPRKTPSNILLRNLQGRVFAALRRFDDEAGPFLFVARPKARRGFLELHNLILSQ